jgi:hypothetical protein
MYKRMEDMTPDELFDMGERISQNLAVIYVDDSGELPMPFEWDEISDTSMTDFDDEVIDRDYDMWVKSLIMFSYSVPNN